MAYLMPQKMNYTLSNPAPRSAKDMGYDIRGNEQPRPRPAPDIFGTPLGPDVEGDIGQFIHTGRLPRKPEFNTGRNSGKGTPEENPSEGGPGTAGPAGEAATGAEAGGLGEVAELALL